MTGWSLPVPYFFLLDDSTDQSFQNHITERERDPCLVSDSNGEASEVSRLSMFLILDFKYICSYFVNEISNCSYFIKTL